MQAAFSLPRSAGISSSLFRRGIEQVSSSRGCFLEGLGVCSGFFPSIYSYCSAYPEHPSMEYLSTLMLKSFGHFGGREMKEEI